MTQQLGLGAGCGRRLRLWVALWRSMHVFSIGKTFDDCCVKLLHLPAQHLFFFFPAEMSPIDVMVDLLALYSPLQRCTHHPGCPSEYIVK